ncbi:aldo/keto reductase [Paenibacillus darwinianus]|uniref:Aldo/keto reductase n=1 Tax=Paenibacillus darwinianus TaxID=1380763 RepID=A0A9W5RZI8_9BACL|nr:aldo/keto reductase [Paenibacillus darwinianus]EXX85140.1 aldo/keto reductase [Paenibacillus darwinianus]EXX90085.1 aldo/keto reductase [Paenibacillus darwinianus]EXX91359.1 aldo/keto reductase [Paenibacillus darwinianus]
MSTTIPLHRRGIQASRLILGCMPLGGNWDSEPITSAHVEQAREAVEAAMESGITMYDHADIYTMGKAEQTFGLVLKEKPGLRDKLILQSKCGIRFDRGPGKPHQFDFSKSHILASVDGILERLGVDYIDILLLHRPDALVEPEEVAEAFERLTESGKVRHFGVSNMGAGQIKLLQAYCKAPLVANQLEMNLLYTDFIDQGIHINQTAGKDGIFPEGTLEFCRLENMQLQAWSPLAKGLLSGASLEGQPSSVKETAALVAAMAERKNTTREAIVLAWLMRHPAGIQPVIGTSDPQRIRNCAAAGQIELSRDEWYELYTASRGTKLP